MSRVLQQRYASPLRYPGGKGKIANFIKLVMLDNDLVGYRYVEPYAGGASVALALLYEEYVEHIHINDFNVSVHAFWDAVLNDTAALCRRIRKSNVTIEEWVRQKAVQESRSPDPLDLAFSTFFLNRTNRSGIIGGGVIGGKNQDGGWKIDARYNKDDLVRRIEKVSRYKSRITLSRVDAAEYLRNSLPGLPQSALVYLDPPYYVKGAGLYENFYEHQDHSEVARLVRRIKQSWMVSYDSTPEVLELYKGFRCINYGLNYSAAGRYRGSEVMFFSPKLKPPAVTSPSNIGVGVVDKARQAVLIA